MLPLRLVAGARRAPVQCIRLSRPITNARPLAGATAAFKQKPLAESPVRSSRSSPRRPQTSHEAPQTLHKTLLMTEKVVREAHPHIQVRPSTLKDPKSPFRTYVFKVTGSEPTFTYECTERRGNTHWRAQVSTNERPEPVIGVGDHPNKREAERIACLSAVLQLSEKRNFEEVLSPKWTPPIVQPVLSDGTELTLARAQTFMDFYCLKFGFEAPNLTAKEARSRWEVVMSVGGNHLGQGYGINKKLATANCYMDVVSYLDSSDPDLWKTFVHETKGRGNAIGLAPPIYANISSRLAANIRDLNSEIKGSELYRKSSLETDNADLTSLPGGSSSTSTSRRTVDEAFHTEKSTRLRDELEQYMLNPIHSHIRDQRLSLPIHTKSDELLPLIDANDVTIVMAATGSGKTTQIPQLILDEWIKRGDGSKCNVICTQPRRIAAISVAERVAKERGQLAGNRSQIGYQVRFDAKLPAMHGSVTFCTTGIFLKRMQSALAGVGHGDGRSLDDVTHIIIDEVHERDVDTDLTLAVIKRFMQDRKARNNPVRIVLMSATIDPGLFQSYFATDEGVQAPVIDIPGRSFPVDKRFMEDIILEIAKEDAMRTAGWAFKERSVTDYLSREVGAQALAQLRQPHLLPTVLTSRHDGTSGEDREIPFPLVALTIAHVLRRSESGHVLVFLPGWEEIQSVRRILSDNSKFPLWGMDFNDSSKYSIHTLHSTIPVAEQQKVFEPALEGVRRIILATNIAETSITIPDVVYVVDTGKVKEKRFDPERHLSSLVSAWVGRSNLNQRAGRAGRHRPGEYYSLVSRARLESLDPYQLVEMRRADLSNVVMHVKALNFPGMDVEEIFSSLIEPPSMGRVHAALETLQNVGALTKDEELTPLGRVLLQIPIDVTFARMVLYGCLFKCLDSAVTLAALLSNREPFVNPPGAKQQALEAKNSWSSPEQKSDAIAALRAYNAWRQLQGGGKTYEANNFCSNNFLSRPVLTQVQKLRNALLHALQTSGVIDVAMAGQQQNPSVSPSVRRDRLDFDIPTALNENADNLNVIGGLIAIGFQPKFATRTSDLTFRTYSDKFTLIHPSSSVALGVNRLKGPSTAAREKWEKYMVTFGEKSQNVSSGQDPSKATTFLKNVTRLNTLQYMLFGAYQVEPSDDGVHCDNWLPVIGGRYDSLSHVSELKKLFEACLQRVFHGIHVAAMEQRQAHLKRNRELVVKDDVEDRDNLEVRERASEGEDDDVEELESQGRRNVATPLSRTELMELKFLTRDVVLVLNQYDEDRKLFSMQPKSFALEEPSSRPTNQRRPQSGQSAFARMRRSS